MTGQKGAGARENRRRRRSLTNVGGTIEIVGAREADRTTLEHALAVVGDESSTYAHVHGFHSYPARMHPVTARRLVEGLSAPDDLVVDPFCGSGTVLVEARLLGRRAWGVDANPLAVKLSWLKAHRTTSAERRRLIEAKDLAVDFAEERRIHKAGPTRRYAKEDTELFDFHVLLELDGLSAGIAKVADEGAKAALRLVLSSMLTKVSRQHGDTGRLGAGARAAPKRLAGGFAIRFFSAKTEELVRRLSELDRMMALPPPERVDPAMPPLVVTLGDARTLVAVPNGQANLVLTSPPYAGNYDYLSHHAPRLRWLGLPAESLAKNEIGSRRSLEALAPTQAKKRWEADLGASLAAMSRVLEPSGTIALLVADSVVSGHAYRADDIVRRLAKDVGLEVVAVGSQTRPHFHGPSANAFRDRPRKEHAILLRHTTCLPEAVR